MVAFKVGEVTFDYQELCTLKVDYSFATLETQFKQVLQVLAKHNDVIVKQQDRITKLESQVKELEQLKGVVNYIQKCVQDHETRIVRCEAVADQMQKVTEAIEESARKWTKLSNHKFGGYLPGVEVNPDKEALDAFLDHLTYLAVDNNLIRQARGFLEFGVAQGDFGAKWTKTGQKLDSVIAQADRLDIKTEMIAKECEGFREKFATHAGQLTVLEEKAADIAEKFVYEVGVIKEAAAYASQQHDALKENVNTMDSEIRADLRDLDRVAARAEDVNEIRTTMGDVQDDMTQVKNAINSQAQAKELLRDEFLDKLDNLQKKIEESLKNVPTHTTTSTGPGRATRGASGSSTGGGRDIVHVTADVGMGDVKKKLEAHTMELETLFDLYSAMERSMASKLDRGDLSKKTDVSQCEQLLLNIADSVDKQIENLVLESPANIELRESLKRLQAAVDQRMPTGGRRGSAHQNSIEHSPGRLMGVGDNFPASPAPLGPAGNRSPFLLEGRPSSGLARENSYTHQPTSIRIRSGSALRSGRGASNANLQLLKMKMSSSAEGTNGILYQGVEGRPVIVNPLPDLGSPVSTPVGDVRERPVTAGVRGGRGLYKGVTVAPTQIWQLSPDSLDNTPQRPATAAAHRSVTHNNSLEDVSPPLVNPNAVYNANAPAGFRPHSAPNHAENTKLPVVQTPAA